MRPSNLWKHAALPSATVACLRVNDLPQKDTEGRRRERARGFRWLAALLSCSFVLVGPLQVFAQRPLPPPKPDKPMLVSPGIELLGYYLRGRALSIDQAVQLALVTNRPLAISTATLLAAEGRTAEAYAALNPTVYGAIDELRLNNSVSNKTLTVLDPKNFNKPIGAEIVNENIQQSLFSVTAQLPIDISGMLHVATQQAKLQELAYKMDVAAARNEITGDVKGAFYDELRAKALLNVAQEDLKNSQDQLHDAQAKLEAQVVTKFDVLRAETTVAASEQNVIVAKNTVQTDLAILNMIMGIKVDTQLDVTEDGAVEQPSATQPIAQQTDGSLGPEFDTDLKEALQDRPEIKSAQNFVEAAQKGVTLALRSDMPSMALGWSYLYAPNAGGSNPLVHTWVGSASIFVPIYDGELARARRIEARGNLASLQVQQRQAVDEVTLEAERAYLFVDQAQQRVVVANQTLIQAQAAFDLAKVRYTAGVSAHAGISPLLELSDAQAALTQAESNQVNALYDYNSAVSQLNRALGRYSFLPEPPHKSGESAAAMQRKG